MLQNKLKFIEYVKLRTLIFLGLFGGMNIIKGQAFYGTTGLLHAPTAVMQKDKTVMLEEICWM